MLSVLSLLGCVQGLHDSTHPTGSTTVVSNHQAVFTVNAWDGTLSQFTVDSGEVATLVLDGEPTRVAKVGKKEVWVTLRAERAIAIFDVSGDAPVEVARIAVGNEPYGLVANEDGSLVYATVSQNDRVIELDADTRKVVRRWDVRDDPRGLSLHPSGRALFVVYGNDPTITRIDLQNGEINHHRPPNTERPVDGGTAGLHPRPTGDPVISPLGDVLIVPTFYVDSDTAGEQPVVEDGGNIRPPPNPYYTTELGTVGLQLSVGRFNGALVALPLSPRDGNVVQDEPMLPIFVGGYTYDRAVRGYVGAATFSPDGTMVYASIEASDAVIVVDLKPASGQGMNLQVSSNVGFDSGGRSLNAPSTGGFYERNQVVVEAGNNPLGVTIDRNGQRWIHERGARKLSAFGTDDIIQSLNELADGVVNMDAHRTTRTAVLGQSRLSADLEDGRKLFYTALDSRVTMQGAGVSCATCHFEGRNDGLTWRFDDNPRQTPSLAGEIKLTAPVTWTLNVATIADEAMITTVGRMGGVGLTKGAAANLEAYLNHTRDVDVAESGRADELVARGAALFARPDVGCAGCHNGPRHTDNKHHRVFGMRVNTPGLTGIDATAPYFHDGSSPTLRAVLERSRDGSMGDTSMLTESDMTALEGYLKTL